MTEISGESVGFGLWHWYVKFRAKTHCR